MINSVFTDIICKIANEQGKDIFFEPQKFKSLLLDYTKNNYKKESALLSVIFDADCVKYISRAQNLIDCKQFLVKRLEDDHSLSPVKSAEMLNLLFFVFHGVEVESSVNENTVAQSSEKSSEKSKIRIALTNAREGLIKYANIMKLFPVVNVANDTGFQTKYNDFYKLRHNNIKFYDAYYLFMEEHKNNIPSFTETLQHLYQFGRLEASFASKILATIDPNLPVWDQFVLRHFRLESPSRELTQSVRVRQANNVYEEIVKKYQSFLATAESKTWIKLFDEYYPEYDITPIKKIDLIIWQLRD